MGLNRVTWPSLISASTIDWPSKSPVNYTFALLAFVKGTHSHDDFDRLFFHEKSNLPKIIHKDEYKAVAHT